MVYHEASWPAGGREGPFGGPCPRTGLAAGQRRARPRFHVPLRCNTGSLRLVLPILIPILIVAWGACPGALAQSARGRPGAVWTLPVEHHPWGRFRPGAWQTVRTVTETLDQKGQVTSTSVTTTTSILQAVTRDSFTLKVTVTMDVDGKEVRAAPKLVERRFDGAGNGQQATTRCVGTRTVRIEGIPVVCTVYEREVIDEASRQHTRIFYSGKVAPYVIKQEQRSTDRSGKEALDKIVEEVVHRDRPRRYLSRLLETWTVKAVRTNSKGSITSLARQCEEIPGGLIDRTTKEKDSTGRLVRRSKLELVSYGFGGRRHLRRQPRSRFGSSR